MTLKHVPGTPIAEDEKGRRVCSWLTPSENYTEAEHEEAVRNAEDMVIRWNYCEKLVRDQLTNALLQIQGEGK